MFFMTGTMDDEGFITFVKSLSTSAAEKMEEEGITPFIVQHMTEDELACFLPRHGDRITVRTHLRSHKASEKKIADLLHVLEEKLEAVRNKKSPKKHADEMRAPHRPYGNKNAAKHKRVIEIGWIHKIGCRSKQIRKSNGGGTRKTYMSKCAKKDDIIQEAVKLFFPLGISKHGNASDFDFDLWDFADRPIESDVTIEQLYDMSKMSTLRVYLASLKKKEVWDKSGESFIVENEPAKEQVVIVEEAEDNIGEQSEVDNQDILSHAMELAGVPVNSENDSDILSSLQPTTTLKIHRGHVLREMIEAFINIDPLKEVVSVQMVMPDGSLEAAEDNGGVTRDALSDFWEAFYDQCTLGTKFKIPFLRHDFAEKEWQAVAKIIVFGWKTCGYLPVKLSLPFFQMCLYDHVFAPMLESFFEVIAEDEMTTFKTAVTDFKSVDMEELLDSLEQHECKNIPTSQNIMKLLGEIAHKEIIQTPMFIVDCFQPVLKTIDIPADYLSKLYSDLIPTAKAVNKILKFPDAMNIDEQTVANHVRRLVKELNSETLRSFVRFCTGSDLMVSREIKVEFVSVSGLARRPVAHTCSCLLELSRTYENFPQFRSEFMSILQFNVWVMDII